MKERPRLYIARRGRAARQAPRRSPGCQLKRDLSRGHAAQEAGLRGRARPQGVGQRRDHVGRVGVGEVGPTVVAGTSEKDAKLVQKLGQPQPLLAVLPQECMAILHPLGQPNTFLATVGHAHLLYG